MQTYATHRRLDPGYHLWLTLMLSVNLIASLVYLIRHLHGPGTAFGLWLLMMAVALILLGWKLRSYPLMVQNRLIRLEERLRLQALLPEGLKARIGDLTEAQLVGLRFASDGEVADRMREAVDEKLSGEQIKKRIQTWRPDNYRV